MKGQFAAGILLALLSGIDLVSAARIAYDCLVDEQEVLTTKAVPSSLSGVHFVLLEGAEQRSSTMVILKAEDAALISAQASLP
jgi:hypothetical protein